MGASRPRRAPSSKGRVTLVSAVSPRVSSPESGSWEPWRLAGPLDPAENQAGGVGVAPPYPSDPVAPWGWRCVSCGSHEPAHWLRRRQRARGGNAAWRRRCQHEGSL